MSAQFMPIAFQLRTLIVAFLPAITLLAAQTAAAPISSDQPIAPGFQSKVIDDKYFDITIKYVYRGRVDQYTWVAHCFIYSDDVPVFFGRSRWPGFARRLPDGSAVYFQMRSDICGNNQASRLILGPAAAELGWKKHGSPMWLSPTQSIMTLADQNPEKFVMPVVFWLNDAVRPTKVELCGLPECSNSQTARVRVLAISGASTASRITSDPRVEAPALGEMTSGRRRFIGYACWRVPLDDVRTQAGFTAFEQKDWAGSYPPSGPLDADRRISVLRGHELPFLNAITGLSGMSSASAPIRDSELVSPGWQKLSYPLKFWGVGCVRDGAKMRLDAAVNLSARPIVMRRLSVDAGSPNQFIMPSGKSINVLDSSPLNELPPHVQDSPWFTADASDDKQTVYFAEAILLSLNLPPA